MRWSGASGASSAASSAAATVEAVDLAARDLVTPRELVALMAPDGMPCVVQCDVDNNQAVLTRAIFRI